jgi:WD40 repeat protein
MLVLKTRRQKIEQVVFSPDSRGLAAHGRVEAYWWPTCQVRGGLRLDEKAGGVGFDPSCRYLLVATETAVTLHHLESRLSRTTALPKPRVSVTSMVATSTREPLFVAYDWETLPLEAWRISSDGSPTQSWSVKSRGPASRPAFAPDGSWFVHTEFRGWDPGIKPFQLVFRSPETGEVIRVVDAEEYAATAPVVSPDGTWLAIAQGEYIVVYQIGSEAAGSSPTRVDNDGPKHFTAVAIHPSGRYLAATSNDTTVKLYDTATWQLDRTFTWDVGRLRSVAFSPDGTLAAVGSDTGRVVVWDVDL